MRENSEAFSKHGNQHSEGNYPQVRMVCLMELSSHLINASALDSESVSEMRLAAQLTDRVPDNSIPLFDKDITPRGCCITGSTPNRTGTGCCP